MNRLSLEILQGEHLMSWLNIQSNIDSWSILYQSCPWRLPFFTPDFFNLWVKHYAPEWNPVLVLGRNTDRRLVGVMPLAQRDHLLTGIGAQQAEYHGWLSAPEDSGDFLAAALQAVLTTFPSSHLRLRYLPPRILSQSVADVCSQIPQVITALHARPLLKLDSAAIEKVLRKKSNRSKINRLHRLGELGLSKLVEINQVLSHIDRIVELYDFRQGAVNDSTPFFDDPNKKAFLLDWAGSSPEELNISCMTLNGELISAHIGVNSDAETHLAILAYSPEFASCSPGKLQIYKTGQVLGEEGQSWLDLTPGGDPWKERFATDHDTVLELNAYSSMAQAARKRIFDRLDSAVRLLLAKLHLSPSRIKSLLRCIQNLNPLGSSQLLRYLFPLRCHHLLYRMDIDIFLSNSGKNDVKINALNHLIRYQQPKGGKPRRIFLAEALANLEAGHKSYTISDQADRLVCCVWLAINSNQAFVEEVDQSVRYPTQGALIYGDFSNLNTNSRHCCKKAFGKILLDLKQNEDTKTVYMNMDSGNVWLQQLVEEFGFKPIASLHFTRFLWHRRHWQDFHPEETRD